MDEFTPQDEIAILKQLNRSGYPFQLAVGRSVDAGTSRHGWYVASREHPWAAGSLGTSRFIDLVLQHKHYSTFRIVAECKRMKTNENQALRWVFIQEMSGVDDERRASSFQVERKGDSDAPSGWSELRVWDDSLILIRAERSNHNLRE